MLITLTRCATAYLIALASACWPLRGGSRSYCACAGSFLSGSTRIESTVAFGATPVIPLPAPCPWPAMSEAIHVPCMPQLGFDGGVWTPL